MRPGHARRSPKAISSLKQIKTIGYLNKSKPTATDPPVDRRREKKARRTRVSGKPGMGGDPVRWDALLHRVRWGYAIGSCRSMFAKGVSGFFFVCVETGPPPPHHPPHCGPSYAITATGAHGAISCRLPIVVTAQPRPTGKKPTVFDRGARSTDVGSRRVGSLASPIIGPFLLRVRYRPPCRPGWVTGCHAVACHQDHRSITTPTARAPTLGGLPCQSSSVTSSDTADWLL